MGKKGLLTVASLVSFITFISGCTDDYRLTGIGSPEPGILRVYLTSDNQDNSIVIIDETINVNEEDGEDSLSILIGQSRAYHDSNLVVVYKTLTDYQEKDQEFNGIKLNGSVYEKFLLYESYVPPIEYDSLLISISSDYIAIGEYTMDVALPDGESPLMMFRQDFSVDPGGITELTLTLKPLASLIRVGDKYKFFRDITVSSVVKL